MVFKMSNHIAIKSAIRYSEAGNFCVDKFMEVEGNLVEAPLSFLEHVADETGDDWHDIPICEENILLLPTNTESEWGRGRGRGGSQARDDVVDLADLLEGSRLIVL